jgi:hypothetical protein
MTQEQKLIADALDKLGAEPLESSRFEAEQYEPDFNDTRHVIDTAEGRS